jgi:hypothetical protein
MSTASLPDLPVQTLERLAAASASEALRRSVAQMDGAARLDHALETIEDLMLFFITMCKLDEKYMQQFDEGDAPPGSQLMRARTATCTLLKAVGRDLSNLSSIKPQLAKEEILCMQIDDFQEVIQQHLGGPQFLQLTSP